MDVQKEISLRNAISYCIENNDANTATNRIMEFIRDEKEAINYTHCCETLNDEGQATLTEYATELINMQENPKDSNKEWKIVLIQNTISKLYETLQTL
jgi:hypothetical protein